MAASLTDNAIAEILSYLPLKVATRLKIVCKSWHELISTPYFRSLALRRPASHDVLGFFQHSMHGSKKLWLARLPNHRMRPIAQCLNGHSDVHILAVCEGIVLAAASFMTQYYVWNPSRGTHIFRCIPPPPAAVGHYGLTKGSNWSSFKIICLVNNLHRSTWIYSSGGAWERVDAEVPPEHTNISLFRNRAGAACARGSILHWLTDCGMIIAFDSIELRYRRMNLPSATRDCNNVWLGSVEEELYTLFSAGGNVVELWALENYEEVRWTKVMEVECPSIITAPAFFDGKRIAVAVNVINESWKEGERGLNFYNTRSRRWEGAQLIPYYLNACLCYIPFIKDIY